MTGRWRIAVVFEVDAADEDAAIQAGDDIVTVMGTTDANPTYFGEVLAGGRQDGHVLGAVS